VSAGGVLDSTLSKAVRKSLHLLGCGLGILQHRCHLLCCSCAMHFGVLLASPAGLVVFLGVFPSLCVLSLVLVCGHCGVWIVVLVKACCV
jgi:hypothetical protein